MKGISMVLRQTSQPIVSLRRKGRKLTRSVGIQSLECRYLLATDIIAGMFSGDGRNLVVDYEITGEAATAFDVDVRLVSTSVSVGQSVTIDNPADLSVGAHTIAIRPAWNSDPTLDYKIEVKLDSDGVVAESNESNNSSTGSGIYVLDDAVHIQGDDGANSISVGFDGSSYNITVDGNVTTLPNSGIRYLEVRSHGSDDVVDLRLIGESSTLLQTFIHAGAGEDEIHGSPVDDSMWGGEDSDQLYGYDGNDELRLEDGGNRNQAAVGHAGNDVLETGWAPTSTTLSGGSDDDRYVFHGNANQGIVDVFESPNSGQDTLDFQHYGAGVTVEINKGAVTLPLGGEVRFNDYDPFSTVWHIERILGTAFNDHLQGDDRDNFLVGFAGNDTLIGINGNNVLDGGGGDDTLTGGKGADRLEGGSGNDQLWGNEGDDQYIFSIDNDLLTSLGTDSLFENADAGFDMLDFRSSEWNFGVHVDLSKADQTVVQGQLDLQLWSDGLADGNAFEAIHGTKYDDTLRGNAGNNTLWGYLGSDKLEGAPGDDKLVGGPGNDSYIFSGDADLGHDELVEEPETTILRWQGIDTLDFSNLGRAVTVDLTESSQVVNDILQLTFDAVANFENIVGSEQDDMLTGNDQTNIINARGGSDNLTGGKGDDSLIGGTGDDTYVFAGSVDLGTDRIVENADQGSDTLDFDDFDFGVNVDLSKSTQDAHSNLGLTMTSPESLENLVGSLYSDTLSGNGNGNRIQGGDGADSLVGGRGDDTLEGGSGDDTYKFAGSIGIGSDTLIEDEDDGTDSLDFADFGFGVTVNLMSSVQDVHSNLNLTLAAPANFEDLVGTPYADELIGNDRANKIQAAGGGDILTGGDGDDTLEGGAGSDSMEGGMGNDTMSGGEGDDEYVFPIRVEGLLPLGTDQLHENSDDGVDVLDFRLSQGRVNVNLSNSLQDMATLKIRLWSDGSEDGSAFEAVYGSPHNDTLQGNDADNALWGYLGDDTLEGGIGRDRLVGGPGGDTYVFGGNADLGHDELVEQVDPNPFFVDVDTLDFSNIEAGVAVDLMRSTQTVNSNLQLTFDVAASFDNIIGSKYDDELTGNDQKNRIEGRGGADVLVGGRGNDTLVGGTGDDTYVFSGSVNLGADYLVEHVSQGVDKLDFSHLQDAVKVDLNSSKQSINSYVDLTLDVAAHFEDIVGSEYGDELVGNDEDNQIDGRGGKDVLIGGKGNDSLMGGAGDDVYVYSGNVDLGDDELVEKADQGVDTLDFSNFGAAVNVDLNSSTQTVNSYLDLRFDSESDFEDVIGSAYNDTLIGNSQPNHLWGRAGDDNMSGGSGKDRLEGGAGDDTQSGGKDDDTYVFSGSVELGSDILKEKLGQGVDALDFSEFGFGVSVDLTKSEQQRLHSNLLLTMIAPDGFEDLIGTQFNDILVGNDSANNIQGRDGADHLTGGVGNDKLSGGKGDDTYTFGGGGDLGSDELVEGNDEGVDTLDFSSFGYAVTVDLNSSMQTVNSYLKLTLESALNFEDMIGSDFADTLIGNSRANRIWGRGDDDEISGGAGNDRLEGESGDDVQAGGLGDDQYVFAGSLDLGFDTLEEYPAEGSDELDFSEFGDGVIVDISKPAQSVHDNLSFMLGSFNDFENVVGTEYGDLIFGNRQNNILTGLDGNDLLVGGAGNDTLLGGKDADRLEGGLGDDRLLGNTGNDVYVLADEVHVGVDSIYESTGEGFDTLDFIRSPMGVNVNLISGHQDIEGVVEFYLFSDEAQDGIAFEGIKGSEYADVLTGNDTDNVLWGQSGDDELRGGKGDDVLRGMDDNDFLFGEADDDRLFGNLGTDTLSGGEGNDSLTGGQGDDTLIGGLHDDTYQFAAAEEDEDLDLGVDELIEGANAGTDTLDFSGMGLGVHVDLSKTIKSVNSLIVLKTPANLNFENIIGSNFKDFLYGNSQNNQIWGLGGHDIIKAREGSDVLIGGLDADNLEGGLGDDQLWGNEGNDQYTFAGSEYLGSDSIYETTSEGGQDAVNFRRAKSGVTFNLSLHQQLVPGLVDITIWSDDRPDTGAFEEIIGSNFGDWLIGNSNDNRLLGRNGDDHLEGLGGHDWIQGNNGNDTLIGGPGDDRLQGGNDDDTLQGDEGDDELNGGLGNDTFVFFLSQLPGDLGTDTLDDTSTPGTDKDTLDFSKYASGFDLKLSDTSLQNVGEALRLILADGLLIEWVIGSRYDDNLEGNDNDNIFWGGEGFDTFDGLGGNDIFDPGPPQ